MPQYKFTAQAERDLEAITEYTLDKWGHRQADIYLDGLTALARKLADTQDLRAHRDTLIRGLLSFPYVSHALYCLKESHGITVIPVLHQRMSPKRHISSP